MILDIEQKEVNVGDEVISTIGTIKCYRIQIVKFTDKGIHYKMYHTNTQQYSNVIWYMHKSGMAARNMYKI